MTLHESIQQRAFFIWLNRVEHDLPGDHLQDWFQAEEELVAKQPPVLLVDEPTKRPSLWQRLVANSIKD